MSNSHEEECESIIQTYVHLDCITIQDKGVDDKDIDSIKALRADLALKYLNIITNDTMIDDKIATMLIRKKYHTTLYFEKKTSKDDKVRRYDIMNTPLKYLIVDQKKRLQTPFKDNDKEWNLSLFQILDEKLADKEKFDSGAYEDSKRCKIVITRSFTGADAYEGFRKLLSHFGGVY